MIGVRALPPGGVDGLIRWTEDESIPFEFNEGQLAEREKLLAAIVEEVRDGRRRKRLLPPPRKGALPVPDDTPWAPPRRRAKP